jgi:hypothetical protein
LLHGFLSFPFGPALTLKFRLDFGVSPFPCSWIAVSRVATSSPVDAAARTKIPARPTERIQMIERKEDPAIRQDAGREAGRREFSGRGALEPRKLRRR